MMGLATGGVGLIGMILFWILIVAAAVWLVSRLFPQTLSYPSPPSRDGRERDPDSAMDILKQRFARGEITKSEYLEMRNTLRN
jgi:putative membrane protein